MRERINHATGLYCNAYINFTHASRFDIFLHKILRVKLMLLAILLTVQIATITTEISSYIPRIRK